MITILFWNTNKKVPAGTIANLAEIHSVDILLLAEYDFPITETLRELNRDRDLSFHAIQTYCDRISIYSRFPSRYIKRVAGSPYYTVKHVCLPAQEDFLLVAVHLKSKLFQASKSQTFGCIDLSEEIRDAEEKIGNCKTLLVGDLNVNPFEDGVVGAKGLHGVMTRRLTEKVSRKVEGKDYLFFYNPMWSFFGDLPKDPPGTYYYHRSEYLTYFWNIFDQVLVRPALLKHFNAQSLKILTTIGNETLMTRNGIPNKTAFSDHFPILFTLEI